LHGLASLRVQAVAVGLVLAGAQASYWGLGRFEAFGCIIEGFEIALIGIRSFAKGVDKWRSQQMVIFSGGRRFGFGSSQYGRAIQKLPRKNRQNRYQKNFVETCETQLRCSNSSSKKEGRTLSEIRLSTISKLLVISSANLIHHQKKRAPNY